MRHFRQFGDLLCKGNGGPPLTSLGIDLSNSSVWDMCAQIMTVIPDLNELCFTGKTKTKNFQDTKLGSSCANFNGTSLVLRHATFTNMSFAILLHLRRTTITSFILDETQIATDPDRGGMWWDREIRQFPGIEPGTPFFPNLERVKFIGLPPEYRGLTEMALCQCFIAGSRLKHIEVGGLRPQIVCDEESLSHEMPNREYIDMRLYLLFMLHQHCPTSLETYSEHDYIEDPFMGDMQSFGGGFVHAPILNIKILGLRCRDLKSLASFDGPDDCTSGNVTQQGWQDHSAWMYLSVVYEHFPHCDCILLQTEEQGNLVPEGWWKLPSERMINNLESSLRYFIVGNQAYEYSGIERRMEEPLWRNDFGRISWDYREMDSSDECRRIIAERWNSSDYR
jgi:hypothetical protein